MAKLPTNILENIFEIQRGLIECINSTTETGFRLFQQYGETATTLLELGELDSIREKLVSAYSRLYVLLLRVSESQPIASIDVLDLLYSSIEMAESILAASNASLKEIQYNWNDL